MLELKNDDLLEEVVEKAIDSARGLPRWVHAIIKAAGILRTGDLAFMTYDETSGELLLVSDSNNIYSSNGSCQCRAFVDFKQPCWHRAAARLVKRYFERENASVPLVVYRDRSPHASRELYECQERTCGWRGPWSELGSWRGDHDREVCPKCEGSDLAEVVGIDTSPARLTARIGNYAGANALEGARK